MAKQKKDNRTKEQKSQQRAGQLKSQRRGNLNKMANDAAKYWGLNASQKQAFHRELTSLGNDDLTYQELKDIALRYRNT